MEKNGVHNHAEESSETITEGGPAEYSGSGQAQQPAAAPGIQHSLSGKSKSDWKYLLILCVVGLLINYLLAHLATGLHLPLYLDNIGSASLPPGLQTMASTVSANPCGCWQLSQPLP